MEISMNIDTAVWKMRSNDFMKILFYQWHSFMNEGIECALKKLNIEYDIFFYQLNDWEKDDNFVERLRKQLKKCVYTAVFSVNYVPLISEVCEETGLRYASWVYDSPIHIYNLETLKNSCNEIYFFDRVQAEGYKKEGINAYHMPLAVDADVFAKRIKSGKEKVPQTDISLLGKLYQTEYAGYIEPLSQYSKGYLEGILAAQEKVVGGYLISELITNELLQSINTEYKKQGIDFCMGNRELEYMLACECTGRDRYKALAILSGYFHVDLYSNDKAECLKNVHYQGYADYYNKMPLVFANSKVNLNISLKTIQTGIPLRVLDVIGCGGFVISNYQQELAEHFVLDEECVIYESLGDLFEKVSFYLAHENVRDRIVKAGFEKVKRDFTFEDRMRKILIRG